MITEVFAPEPDEIHFLSKPECAALIEQARLGIISGDQIGNAWAYQFFL